MTDSAPHGGQERHVSEQRVGTCSLCGGSVYGIRGAWFSINPPPPDKCTSCGAVAQSDVIEMHPQSPRRDRSLHDRINGHD